MAWTPLRSRDHVLRALNRFTEQFKEKPVMAAMLAAWIGQVQKIEDAALEVLDARANPVGVALDRVGEIVGRGRGDLDDVNYLRAITAQILANRSSGQTDTLLHIFELVSEPGSEQPEAYEPGNATLVLVSFEDAFPLVSTWQILKLAKGGGVRLLFTYSPLGVSANDFAFAGTVEGQGFGSVYEEVGGRLRGVFNA